MWPHGRTGRRRTDKMPAAGHFAVLQRNARLRRWSLAIVPGGAVGLFSNLVLKSWLVLLAVPAIAIGLLLWDHRSGALAGWWPGDRGRYRLAAAAARLERRGSTVLCDPAIPNQDPGRIAYLLIGPGGVFVVERQVWTVKDAVTVNAGTGLLMVGGRPAGRRAGSVRAAAAAVDEALSDKVSTQVPVHPVLAIHGLTLDQPRSTIGVTILPTSALARFVRRTKPVLTASDITMVTHTARRLHNP